MFYQGVSRWAPGIEARIRVRVRNYAPRNKLMLRLVYRRWTPVAKAPTRVRVGPWNRIIFYQGVCRWAPEVVAQTRVRVGALE